jgi:hypothetical protein
MAVQTLRRVTGAYMQSFARPIMDIGGCESLSLFRSPLESAEHNIQLADALLKTGETNRQAHQLHVRHSR